jgi:pyruvate/2-oxoglutarate dehydrogenase complex dihydrolipoamide acyltransferase (E2) component
MTYTLEQLAPGIDEATVTAWYVKVGDIVAEDDDLLDVTTDKAVVTIPAPCSGTIASCDVADSDLVTAKTHVVSFANDNSR